MQYIIHGKLIAPEDLRLPHEEFVTLLQTKLVPTLKLLHEGSAGGKVVAGGMPAGTREWHLIVELPDLHSHRVVNVFLQSLPVFDYFEWTATPLVTIGEYWEQFNAK